MWFAAGAAAGVYGMVKVRRLVEAFTPDGMRDRVSAAVVGARMLRDEVAQGMADAETGLRERFQPPSAGHRELTSSARSTDPTPNQDERGTP